MRAITRIHLSDCGWHEAYYRDLTVPLADPRTGKPEHTVLSLENTGGKTSFLALVLSCFDTNERRFLKTLIRQNQRFADYFGEVPAFIIVEWDLSAGQTSLLGPERLVTGQVVVPRGEGQRRDVERRFFSFRSTPELALEDIPARGLRGFKTHGPLNGHQDVQRWLHSMRVNHPGNFQVFGNQSEWKRKLAEEKIDAELIAAQVEFNRNEGGIEDFLNFRTEDQFVRKFLALTLPEAEAESVRSLLAEHVARLTELPILERRRDAMRGLKDRFAPFLETAREAHAAEESLAHHVNEASGLQTGLETRRAQAEARQESEREKADRHEMAAKAAQAACRAARVELASATLETARRRHEVTEQSAKASESEETQARKQLTLLQAASAMRDILDDRARAQKFQDAIDAANADLEPHRAALRRLGTTLAATLNDRAAVLRKHQRACTEAAEDLKRCAAKADEDRRAALDHARSAHKAIAGIDRDLEHASESRRRLEAEGIIEPGESADLATNRHAQAAEMAKDSARILREEAHEHDRKATAERERESKLKEEQSGLRQALGLLRNDLQEGETKRGELAFDPTILKLAGVDEIDPDADGVERLLDKEKTRTSRNVREDESRIEILRDARESLEATGLAGIDKDVRLVVERLREAGLHDAQPHAVYTSRTLRRATTVRSFAEHDPAAFGGVAVPNSNALEAARRALHSPPPLSRPMVVVNTSAEPADAPRDRFVIPVEEAAAYDRDAASALSERIETELDRLAKNIDRSEQHIERLDTTLRELKAWKERFGTERLKGWHREANQHEERIRAIDNDLAAVSGSIQSAVHAADTTRDQAQASHDEAHARGNLALRTREHEEQWGSRIEGWERERLELDRDAKGHENRARASTLDHERLQLESREKKDEATESAKRATSLEQEATRLAYADEGGDPGSDLDALREEYAAGLTTLTSLEEKEVDELRGRLLELERIIGTKETEFKRSFASLDRERVETESRRGGIRDATHKAEEALEVARSKAATAQAEARSAHKEYELEKRREREGIKPEQMLNLRELTPEELADLPDRAKSTLLTQEGIRDRETQTAAVAGKNASSNGQTATQCARWTKMLDGALTLPATIKQSRSLPEDEEALDELVSETVAGLFQANEARRKTQTTVQRAYEAVRHFIRSPAFAALETERVVATHLAANDPLDAAAHAPQTANLIDERLKTIEHDLARLDEDRDACVAELERLLSTTLHIVRRMLRDGRIPEHVPRFGGEPVFKMDADLSRVPVTQRRDIIRSYVSDLAEANRIPETGQDIAATLVDRMRAALGKSSLGIQLLKPKGEGKTEHMPIDKVTVSGGELLTAAMMIYVVLARLRAEAMPGSTGEAGVLILDNPLGKANKALLLKTQIGLADAMGIQLFYTTGIQDQAALGEFENIVKLRRNRQSQSTGRIHVELEPIRVHIDRDPTGAGKPTFEGG